MILADPTATVLREELPPLVKSGHASIKLFMTYEQTKVDDEQLLDTLIAARENRALVCVHAENNGMISWMGRRLVERGYRAPKYHAVHHPRLCESEAIYRLAAFSELIDQPVIVYHVSTAEGGEGDPRGARPGRQDVRRDVHAIPDADASTTSTSRVWMAPNGCAARRCA